MEKKISRRDFLKGAAVGAVGVASVGLLGACDQATNAPVTDVPVPAEPGPAPSEPSPGPAPVEAAPQQDLSTSTIDKTYGSILNPQDEGYDSFTTDYSAIFSPLKIGGVTLANRIVKSAAGSETQHSTEWPSDTSLKYYEQFAKGGVGMICFESSTLYTVEMPPMDGPPADGSPADGPPADGALADAPPGDDMKPVMGASLDFTSDAGIPAHAAVADYIHQFGTPVIAQMYDMMTFMGTSTSLVETTDLEASFSNGHMQTTEEVNKEQGFFIDAIERYYKAGFDGVELNASCNHYFASYISRYANNERTDQYSGASIENRARVITEIITEARKRVGNDFIIQVLFSGIEENIHKLGENEGCTTVEEACELAKLFEKAGASSLHIRSQTYGHHVGGFMPDVLHLHEHGETGYYSVMDYNKHLGGSVVGSTDGYGALIEVAAKIKSCVNIPVGAVGSMDPRMAPDLINNAIRDGKLDFILVTRSLMADPEMPNKLKEGRRDECAPCTRCMTCFVAPYDFGTPMYCRVNPSITRAYSPDMPEGYDPPKTASPKKVMVIGGGPAGMEAARIAAQCGHKVTLYEKSGVLGGAMNLAAKIKGTHEKINAHRDYLANQMKVLGVTVVMDKEVDIALVQSEAPEAVIVAVGGVCENVNIQGMDASKAFTYDDLQAFAFSDEELPLGEKVVIVGGQFQAGEIAVHLMKRGKKVTMLNPGPEGEFFMNSPTWPRMMGKRWLYGKGLKIYHNCDIKNVSGDSMVFNTEYGVTQTVPFESIVLAKPYAANRELFNSISSICDEVYAVGDCYSPNTIANATARANVIARRIGAPPAAQAPSGAAGGNTFSATAIGIGDVTVTITVDSGKITDAVVDTSNETVGIGRELGAQMAGQIVSNGAVDAVSGATLTVNAVQTALADCMKQAGLR